MTWIVDSQGNVRTGDERLPPSTPTPPKPPDRLHWGEVAAFLVALWFAGGGGQIVVLDLLCASGAYVVFRLKLKAADAFGLVCAAAAIGLAPQSLFLIAFNSGFRRGIESVDLPRLAGKYEEGVLALHEFVEHYVKVPSWFVFLSAILVLIALPRAKARHGMKWLATYSKAVTGVSTALLAATTFTLLSPLPSAGWTPDLDARLQAVLQERARADATKEAAKYIQAELNVSEFAANANALASAVVEQSIRYQPALFIRRSDVQRAAYDQVAKGAVEDALSTMAQFTSPPRPVEDAVPTPASLDSIRDSARKAESAFEESQVALESAITSLVDAIPFSQVLESEFVKPVIEQLVRKICEAVGDRVAALSPRNLNDKRVLDWIHTASGALAQAALHRGWFLRTKTIESIQIEAGHEIRDVIKKEIEPKFEGRVGVP
jgi:hypothetical protein